MRRRAVTGPDGCLFIQVTGISPVSINKSFETLGTRTAMKTSPHALSLVAAALALIPDPVAVALPIAPPTPDLVITKVVENGTVAVVQIRNVGSAIAGASSLRVWHNFGLGWFITATIPVAPIPPGTTLASGFAPSPSSRRCCCSCSWITCCVIAPSAPTRRPRPRSSRADCQRINALRTTPATAPRGRHCVTRGKILVNTACKL